MCQHMPCIVAFFPRGTVEGGGGRVALRPAAFSEKMNLTLHAVLSWLTAITTLSDSGTDVDGGPEKSSRAATHGNQPLEFVATLLDLV